MDPALHRILQALGPDAQVVVVGGTVRDRLLGRTGGDWDLATRLLPEAVLARAQAAGVRAIPTGLKHGTVTLVEGGRTFEVTTFRGDGVYLDGRHPESVTLGVSLDQDLARRDFTINAMAVPAEAMDREDWAAALVDPHGGRRDLEAGVIRAVGDPLARFGEDGLRCLRACRFQAQLDFAIDPETRAAIPRRLEVAGKVAVERVLAELTKLLCGPAPDRGLQSMAAAGLLDLWLPELRPMIGCTQNHHHRYPVWEHVLEVTRRAPPEPDLRWAALLHDCGKPAARTVDARGVHFKGHEPISVAMAEAILARLRAGQALTRQVLALVRHHGTHPGPGWGDAACRRFLKRLLEDRLPLERWAQFRFADQAGKGFGEEPFRPAHEAMVARLEALAAQAPPLAVEALALDGRDLLALSGRPPGPWLGQLQHHLMEAVLEDPASNQPEALGLRAQDWLGRHLHGRAGHAS
jgi:tRNA nucleotidyltransferase (CCA-adding enzyme)